MRLTKTQREVLAEARDHRAGRVSVHAWSQANGRGIGHHGRSGGQRKLAAMCALRDLGLVDRFNAYHHRGYSPLGTIPIYSTEAVAFITQAGRDAIPAAPSQAKAH